MVWHFLEIDQTTIHQWGNRDTITSSFAHVVPRYRTKFCILDSAQFVHISIYQKHPQHCYQHVFLWIVLTQQHLWQQFLTNELHSPHNPTVKGPKTSMAACTPSIRPFTAHGRKANNAWAEALWMDLGSCLAHASPSAHYQVRHQHPENQHYLVPTNKHTDPKH